MSTSTIAAAREAIPENVEQLHRCFRGANELAKKYEYVSLVFDFLAALLALAGLVTSLLTNWRPLFVLILTVCSLVIRLFLSEAMRTYAQRCRRLSLRAYCEGTDIDIAIANPLIDEAPRGYEAALKKLPSNTSIADYYVPANPPGEDRLRELYAHSAFYTNRLLLVYGLISLALAAVMWIFGIAVIYSLAINKAPTDATRGSVADAICSVVFIVFGLRAAENAIRCLLVERQLRLITDALLRPPFETGALLRDLADTYDYARLEHPEVPTPLYLWLRPRLKESWNIRRKILIAKPAPAAVSPVNAAPLAAPVATPESL